MILNRTPTALGPPPPKRELNPPPLAQSIARERELAKTRDGNAGFGANKAHHTVRSAWVATLTREMRGDTVTARFAASAWDCSIPTAASRMVRLTGHGYLVAVESGDVKRPGCVSGVLRSVRFVESGLRRRTQHRTLALLSHTLIQ